MEENSVSFVTAWGSTLPLILVLMGLTAMALLYVARTPAHELILSVGRTLQAWLVLLARFLMRGAASLSQRNREALLAWAEDEQERALEREDRKSTRLNSSHVRSSYAVFGLKKKRQTSPGD